MNTRITRTPFVLSTAAFADEPSSHPRRPRSPHAKRERERESNRTASDMVRVPSFAATEEALAAATPDSVAGGPQEAAKDPQPPPTSAAATSDTGASYTEVSARRAIAQEPLADPSAVDDMGVSETHADAADPPANPTTNDGESSTQPNEAASPWSVEDSLSGKPRAATADELDALLDEEEFSLAGDGESSLPSTQSAQTQAATEEPIATAQPVAKEPTQAHNAEATATPSPSPVTVVVEEVITSPRTITPAPVTTKPLLRTENANAVVSDPSTLHSRLNQGNPLLLISFAVICCGFLILWVRKRKIHSSGGGGNGLSSDGGSGSGSGGKGSSKIASKVQYSRIENKKESPFEEDDDGDDDDDERGDNWDDWEGGDMGRLSDEAHVTTNAYQSSLYAHPNPFAASMVSPPESPELVAQSAPPQFRFAAPAVHHQAAATPDYLSEIVVSTGVSATTTSSDSQKATSPGSNSSSDSYEVVTDDPILLHSSPFTSSKKSPPKPSEDADKQVEDDLFSVR